MEGLDQPAPLCFVLMPFGRKMDAAGRVTNFDSIYQKVIVPAVQQAGLEPVRADEEKIGGTIHKPMFERLMLCHYAVADITGANPNVFYELGIRHALRPRSTVILFREGTVLPFDIVLVRGISYKTDGAGEPVEAAAPVQSIATQLEEARGNPHDDSPVFQLVDDLPRWEIDHTKTDVFRKSVDYSKRYKTRLAAAVKQGAEAVASIAAEAGLANLSEVETGIVVDLFLSLRDVKAYDAMIALYDRMPLPLQRAKMMREQHGFALNRQGRFEEAEKVLKAVIDEFGPSSETNGLLGRIYKEDSARRPLRRRAEGEDQRRLLGLRHAARARGPRSRSGRRGRPALRGAGARGRGVGGGFDRTQSSAHARGACRPRRGRGLDRALGKSARGDQPPADAAEAGVMLRGKQPWPEGSPQCIPARLCVRTSSCR